MTHWSTLVYNIVITGGQGQLGQALIRATPLLCSNQLDTPKLIAPSSTELNIVSSDIMGKLSALEPNCIIHCAAMTRPMIDHENNPNTSIYTNIIGTANIAMFCNTFNVRMVYISTDYVYPGKTGMYRESDGVLPVNKYAWSKLGGECATQLVKDHLILRCAFTATPWTHKYAFNDVYKSIIDLEEAAEIILGLAMSPHKGVLNLGGNRDTIYNHIKKQYPDVLPISRAAISEPTPTDISIDSTALRNLYILNI